ncbi:hypothetical protein C8A03DRAFT_19029 [Achaetomium macrosporum]|uniref:Uncharacterized protein n=1 Tax=Achaetomium macrosporum TaxID=79813 RepID=A0AAN7C2T7_9PEZI|nr:hypothetical protein C8A03DRAFT_19029 [Achaetomium macrosporum]
MSSSNNDWREGDIAFLMPSAEFSSADYDALIRPSPGAQYGYVPPKATGHPVISVRRLSERSTHVLITPVSAYSSGPANDYLAPWKQVYHSRKNPRDFRAFHGSERPSDEFPPLFLEKGAAIPKPRTSWVHIQSLWVVPLTVLKRFTKSRQLLRVRADSLDDLRRHMARGCKSWRKAVRDLETAEPGQWGGAARGGSAKPVKVAGEAKTVVGGTVVRATAPANCGPRKRQGQAAKSWAAMAGERPAAGSRP